jgi:cation-dependent mannose-6-phosphate receptor
MLSLSFQSLALGLFAVLSGLTTAASNEKTPAIPCTIRSPNSGSFYDLRSLSLSLPDPDAKAKPGAKTDSWHARGWDYGSNFTMNICAPVIEDIKDVVGVDKAEWKNVSAYYTKGDKIFSIG